METGAAYAMDAPGFRTHGHRFFGRTALVETDPARVLEIDDPHDLARARALAPLLDPTSVPTSEDVDAVVLDFDGTQTDDRVLVDADGRELVAVHRGDGLGIAALRRAGLKLLILSTEQNPVVAARARKLAIPVLHGIDRKDIALKQWCEENAVAPERVLYAGNDVNDLPCFGLVGWPVAVASAHDSVRAAARAVTATPGGAGRDPGDRHLASRSHPHHPHPVSRPVRNPLMNSRLRTLGSKTAGPGHPVYVTGEIGINHNGDLDNAIALIDAAADAGCDAVKFQKRTPEICTPRDQWDIERDTPWGRMTYIDYRHRVEFGEDEYRAIDEHCKKRGIDWFASPWDTEAVAFLEKFDLPAHKVASASLTDDELLRALRATGKTVILSTGMSTPKQIRHAVEVLGSDNILLCHATSTYPAKAEELNLRVINTLMQEYPNVPIGYSGHETGLQTTLAAVALGAAFVERHITLDRAMWGSDQAASVEPGGLQRLVRDIRTIEAALGDGVKKVYDSELAPMKKLRRVAGVVAEQSEPVAV